MKLKFKTENGTWYKVTWSDKSKRGWWERLSSTLQSGRTRNNKGRLVSKPLVKLGAPALMYDEDVQKGYVRHAIQTSYVTEIVEQ